MDAAALTRWLVLVHVLAVFVFLIVHGGSATVAFKLRGEHDPVRIGALLDLSRAYLNAMYGALLVVMLAGIAAGITAGRWTSGELWIWASVVLLVAILVAMYVVPLRHFDALRHAVGQSTYDDTRKGREPPAPASEEELVRLLLSSRTMTGAMIGFGGLLLITWLMVVKPF